MKRLWATGLLVLVAAMPLGAKTVDGIAAVVNGQVITRTEVDEAAEMLDREGVTGEPVRKQALDRLVEQSLITQEAERLGIRVGDDEVEKAICEVCERNNIDRDKLPAALAAQGVVFEAYQERVTAQLRQMKLASRVLRARMAVSDGALREFYLKNVSRFRKPDTVHLYHLQFDPDVDRAGADAARARIRGGEPFVEVVRELSAGPGAEGGGDMGYLPVKSLAAAVADAVEGIPEGEVTEPVHILDGWHLFEVAERVEGGIPSFEEAKDQVQDLYFKEREKELYKTWVDSLRAKARVEVKM